MQWLVILRTCRKALQNNKAVHGLHISLLWKTVSTSNVCVGGR